MRYPSTLAVALAASVFLPSLFADTNLIVNPGAETGAAGPAVPGWTTTGTFEVVAYSAGGGFPALTDPGSPNRAQKFFSGGQGGALSSALQTISLDAFSAAIDSSSQGFTLSGWLGGFSSQDDHCDINVTFLSASAGTLGQATIGGVRASQRNWLTGMLFRTTSGVVPAGTRSARVEILMTREAGSYNDGYADDLSLTLHSACVCDLNGDALVEDSDFSIFVVAYNTLDCADPSMTPDCPADFNRDGLVDDSDFSIFVVAYDALLCP
ncbi:MAG: hypothetical protein U0573_01840 [Phycisphaerales bacterium]|nr:hypothetical protein [Planctomycetota bacterium]